MSVRPSLSRRDSLFALAAAAGTLAGALSGCGRRPPRRGQPVAPGARVLALGDSLTHGTGAPPESAYPAVLAGLTGWEVVNAGVPGDVSAQALARLPGLLAEHQPALVLVGIGGNDLLRRGPETTLRENLRAIARAVQAAAAQALIIAVPRPTLSAAFTGRLDDHPLYAEVADELALPLHADGWSRVLADERLRSDQIHANAEGYRRFAEGLRDTLKRSGLLV